MFNKVKGTQDILDYSLVAFVLDQFKQHANTYNFSQIEVPILESTTLFHRSLGLQTDVVSKEMFIIQPVAQADPSDSIRADSSDKERICLRPEGTAGIVRAFVENGIQQLPWKVFIAGPMFRYERPQKGRQRQFTQISMEVIGSAAIETDAQLITMLDRFFAERLKPFNCYVLELNFLGCAEDRHNYKQLLLDYLNAQGIVPQLCPTCQVRLESNYMRIFDCKNAACQELYKDVPKITQALCEPCAGEWQILQESLDILSVNYRLNPYLVRGLDYYNKTVFEFTSDVLGAQSTFCGGGRYDQLVGHISGKKDAPSVGAGIGLERLLLALEPIKDQLMMPQSLPLQVIVPLSRQQHGLALLLADELRAHNLCVEVLIEGDSMKSMMRKADKLGAAHVLIIGPDEQAAKEVTLKNMITGQEQRVAQVDVILMLK